MKHLLYNSSANQLGALTRVLSLIAVVSISFNASAALYVAEDFDYTLSSSVGGQNGGTGWAGGSSWTTAGGTPTATIVSGLTFNGLQTSGNAVSFDESADTTSYVQRSFGNTAPANSDLWVSYLFNHSRDTNNGFGDGSLFGHEFRGTGDRKYFSAPKSTNGFGPFETQVGPTKDEKGQSIFDLAQNQTFLVVSAFNNIDTPAFSGQTTTSRIWVLSETDFAAVQLAGISEASLDANNTVFATHSYQPTFGAPDLPSTDNFRLVMNDGTAVYDEILVGTEIGDVFNTIPEPSTYALLFLSGLLLFVLRGKRKQKS
ncbi:MAG: PEP-CTERM sorting domain-containing protein [Verrucomicrobiota bacterium]